MYIIFSHIHAKLKSFYLFHLRKLYDRIPLIMSEAKGIFCLAIAIVIVMMIGLLLFSQGCIVDLPDTCIMFVPIKGISTGYKITTRVCDATLPYNCYDGKLLIEDTSTNLPNTTACTLIQAKGWTDEKKLEERMNKIQLGQTYDLYKSQNDICYDDNKNIESYTYIGIIVLCICGVMHLLLVFRLYKWIRKTAVHQIPDHNTREEYTMHNLSDFPIHRSTQISQ